ncbi:ABC transporter permease [Streptomyces sp. NRRL S-31]|uniref:ABC transporter permease n=1 Tax=Streptomyces sp. NRRL S-31 TaxID=1463898 RepID=UPI0004CC01A9|nr:ABC transporter permease [Streptomyces sp. NRRL S-31]
MTGTSSVPSPSASRLLTAGRVVWYSAANALADFRATYSWYSWTFGWLTRLLSQVAFFAVIGVALDSARTTRYLFVGNALMLCVIEATTVIVSSAWERTQGTLTLLAASPASTTWVLFGRGLQWPVSGVATSLVALLGLGPPFGVHWRATDLPPLVAAICLTAAASYAFGLFLAAFALNMPSARNLLYNGTYLVMMCVCGVQVPRGYWPPWIRAVAAVLPASYGVDAVRAVAARQSAGAVVRPLVLLAATGAGWLLIAFVAVRAVMGWARRRNTLDFSS